MPDSVPKRLPRRLWWWAGLALGLPLAAAAAIYLWVSPEKLRPVVERQLSMALQREVGMEKLTLSFLPLSLMASEFAVKERAEFGAGDFTSVKRLGVHVKLLPLLRGAVEISSLTLLEPRIELRQNKAGQWNWQTLGKQGEGGAENLHLEHFEVLQATIGVTGQSGDRDEYRRLNLRVAGYREGSPFHGALSAVTEEGAELGLDGTFTVSSANAEVRDATLHFAGLRGALAGKLTGESLDFTLDIPSSPIAEAAPLFVPKGTNVQGQISARIAVKGTTTAPSASGDLAVQDFVVAGGEIRSPVKTERLQVQFSPERIVMAPAQVASGGTRLEVEGMLVNYAAANSPPRLQLSVAAPDAQLEELLAIAKAYGAKGLAGVQGEGKVQFAVKVEGPLGKNQSLRYAGSASVDKVRIEPPELNKPLLLDSARLRFAENSMACESLAAQVGSSKLSGSLRIDNFSAPRLNFDLAADQVLLKEVEALFPEQKAAGKPLDISALGNLTIGKLDLDTVVLEKLQARVEFRNQQVTLAPLTASLYGGSHSGILRADLRQHPPRIQLNSRLQEVESGSLLAAATPVRGFLSGPLASDVDLEFVAGDPAELTRSLSGKLSFDLRKGQVGGINLTNEIASVAKFLGYQPSAAALTEILSLTGDLALSQGKVSTENLELRIPNLVAGIEGSLDLNSQTMNLKMVNVLDAKFSEQVGGSRVGAFLTTALSGPQGGLIIPVTLSGSFQNPRVSPDAAAIARLKLENFSPSNPENLRRGLDSVLGIFRKKQ